MSSSPLVRIEHADVAVGGTTLLHDIDWQLERGAHWGIVGENGSGKSTLLGLIAGSLWPAPGRGTRRYDFGGGELTDAVEARRRIVVVSHELQDLYARWKWNFTALDVVLSGVYRTSVPRRRPEPAERHRALAVMRSLEIAPLAARPFLELSRGQQRRVLIARGVAFEPVVLLLDEPASGLDAAAREELGRMIERIADGVTIVCTAHLAADLPPVIGHVLQLSAGRVVRAGRRHAALAEAPLEPAPRRARMRADGAAVVEIDNADVWLGARCVLHAIDWRLAEHEHWLVTGGNGAGKSSFLRLLHGQLRPALGGSVRWPALANPRDVWSLRRRVAWVSPELQANYRYPTRVRDVVGSGFHSSIGLTRPLDAAQTARVEELIAQFELGDLAGRELSTLSYGQARRALIARALAIRPRVLLLDEPWEGLDRPQALRLNAELDAATASGTQLVCASHLSVYRESFTHELVLDQGRIVSARALHDSGQ